MVGIVDPSEPKERRTLLTPEEIDKIRERESIALQIRQALNPEKPKSHWASFCGFFNSPFFVTVIGSLAVTGATWLWNSRADERLRKQRETERQIAMQREDSQFLVSLMSYMNSPDKSVKDRTVYVIMARYPDGQMPPGIQGNMGTDGTFTGFMAYRRRNPKKKAPLSRAGLWLPR